jgi:hypothetical protein
MEKTSKSSPSNTAAKNMLPPELHAHLDELVAHYRFAALKHHGREWATPKVLAELVLMGWRRSAAVISEEQA